MKFSQIVKGKRAVKPISFPMSDGVEATCVVRPLLGYEDVEVLEKAREFAIAKGVAEPEDGNPIYERGRWVNTLLLGCCDQEAPEEPYFESADQILSNLGLDHIALVFELHQVWQDECSPRKVSLTGDEYIKSVVEMATAEASDELPFVRWRPALRESWVRTSARLLLTSPELKSQSGSSSELDSKTSSNPSLDS